MALAMCLVVRSFDDGCSSECGSVEGADFYMVKFDKDNQNLIDIKDKTENGKFGQISLKDHYDNGSEIIKIKPVVQYYDDLDIESEPDWWTK